jgi:hypothetical protein
VSVPYSALATAANNATNGMAFEASGNPDLWDPSWSIAGVTVFSGNLGGSYDIKANKNGPITVSNANPGLAISVPVAFSGTAGVNGTLANWFSVTGKNFSGAFHANASTQIVANQQFCPQLQNQSVSASWDPPASVEVVGHACVYKDILCWGPWNLDISGSATGPLNSALSNGFSQVNSMMPCQPIQNDLAKVWKNYSFPLTIPDAPPLYVNVKPQALYVPGVSTDSNGATVNARLDAYITVDPTAGSTAPITPLPQNQPLPQAPGNFSISVPLSVPYASMQAAATAQLVGKEFTVGAGAEQIKIWPKKIEIYPSGDKLVIGVGFALHQAIYILNTSGTVWFEGSLQADSTGQKIVISNVAITRQFSNPIWDIASVLLQGQIQNAVSQGFVVDLTSTLNTAKGQMATGLSNMNADSSVKVTVANPSIGVGRIYTGDTNLTVEGLLTAKVLADLGSISP